MAGTVRRGVRLGVDVGTVRVGLAASDPHAVLASPVETLRRGEGDLDRIAAECRDREAIEIVVGLPRSLSGGLGPAAKAATDYAIEVTRRVAPVPVRLVDERLTTVSAHRALHDSGRKGRKHRQVVDQVAAVMILQYALDTERENGLPPGELLHLADEHDPAEGNLGLPE